MNIEYHMSVIDILILPVLAEEQLIGETLMMTRRRMMQVECC